MTEPGFPILGPAGRLYGRVATARRERYRSGRSHAERLGSPVVSIGNITVGGTGKTPLTILLATRLADEGYRVSILSRGYAGRRTADPLVVDPRAPGAWRLAGDEPVLMARRAPRALVTVGRRRVEAGRLAERTAAVDVHLLDDGFQHLALARELDVVLLAASFDPASALCIPAGPYREPPHALRFADVIVVKEGPRGAAPDVAALAALAAPGTPILRARLVPSRLVPAAGAGRDGEGPGPPGEAPAWLAGRKIGAFAAIADPEAFRGTLEGLGARVVAFDALRDHAAIGASRLARMDAAARSAGAEALVCTEKDAVRLDEGAVNGLPLLALRVELEIDGAARLLDLVRGALAPPRAAPPA